MEKKNSIHCQLAIVGTGLAGIAASSFAVHRGIDVVQVGDTSEISFASGCLDLLGADPLGSRNSFENPWEGIDSLLNINPKHPYGSVSKDSIKSGINEFMGFLSSVDLPCSHIHDKNQKVITPAGTLKTTYCVPMSMEAGANAVRDKKRILLIDIKGLKGFSATQMIENLKSYGVAADGATIEFPGKENFYELNCERMAWHLEMGGGFDLFVSRIKEVVGDADVIGLPAILGIYNSESLRGRLEKELGVLVFEIPTFSPSVTGLRMKEKFLERLKDIGVKLYSNTKVKKIEKDCDDNFVFIIETCLREIEVKAESIILASGRFFGGGLGSKNSEIYETLFNIPVANPLSRNLWYENDFFSKKGHEINRCGIETDSSFRPLKSDLKVVDKNLYAVGSVLANQDWKREKSGAGIAIASSYSAVSAVSRRCSLGNKSSESNSVTGKTAA